MTEPRTHCAALGCSRPAAGVPWSAYCDLHARRVSRNGSPFARALPAREIAKYRDPISRTLAKYLNSSAIKSALLIAHDLLTFRPRTEFSGPQRAMAARMAILRDAGVTPREVLQRVLEIWALTHYDHRFDGTREFDHALARGVLRLRSMKAWRPGGPLSRQLGSEIRENLSTFCTAFCLQMDKDAEMRRTAKETFENGWELK